MEIRSGESSGFLVLHAFVDHALDLLIAEILEGLALDTAQESLPDQFQKTLFLSPGGKRIALFGADLVDNLRGTAFGEILPVFRGEAFPGTVLDCVTNRAALSVALAFGSEMVNFLAELLLPALRTLFLFCVLFIFLIPSFCWFIGEFGSFAKKPRGG